MVGELFEKLNSDSSMGFQFMYVPPWKALKLRLWDYHFINSWYI